MKIGEAVATRRSVRAFEPRPVPRDVLEKVLHQSLRAPSWGNTQPWGFTVVSGKPLTSITSELSTLLLEKKDAHPDLPFPDKWSEAKAQRYRDSGKVMFNSMEIARNDRDKRNEFYQLMGCCFKAPHLIFVHIESGANPYALLDCGLIVQTIALLAVEQGLGTCIMAAAVLFPDLVRRHAPMPSGTSLVTGIAIGYPALDSPLNSFRSERGKPEEFIQWVDG